MTKIPVCLISQNFLLCEGLKSVLADTEFEIVGVYSNLKSCTEMKSRPPEMIVVDSDNVHPGFVPDSKRREIRQEDFTWLKTSFPLAKTVYLVSEQDRYRVSELYSWGADGCFFRDTPKNAFIHYLRLVMMSERIFPPSTVSAPQQDEGKSVNLFPVRTGRYDLSQREKEIVLCLVAGEPNKCIARHLGISEATVKVHLKTILRKLGVTNRTQAAMWAVSHGLGTEPKPVSESREAVSH